MMRKLLIFVGLITIAACAPGNPDGSGDSRQAQPPATTGTAEAPAAADRDAPAGTPDTPPSPPESPTEAATVEPTPEPRMREVTIPAGTTLPLTLRTTVASDKSSVEDPVRATLRRVVTIDGVTALPEGTVLVGHVTDAARSAKVKGRARVAFRFTRADLPGEGGQVALRTATVSRVAPPTKKRDAATIGGGAVGGAIIGGIVGGGDGAAKGAVIGGGAGTGVVLATRGEEVRLPAGTAISVKLSAPLTMTVR